MPFLQGGGKQKSLMEGRLSAIFCYEKGRKEHNMRKAVHSPLGTHAIYPLSTQCSDVEESEEASVKSIYSRLILWLMTPSNFLTLPQMDVSIIQPSLTKGKVYYVPDIFLYLFSK